MIYEPLCRVP
jgi:hypothetical protein